MRPDEDYRLTRLDWVTVKGKDGNDIHISPFHPKYKEMIKDESEPNKD